MIVGNLPKLPSELIMQEDIEEIMIVLRNVYYPEVSEKSYALATEGARKRVARKFRAAWERWKLRDPGTWGAAEISLI